ncbi:hypothetical protein GCM10020219_036990 [Nonomuraea dietziae]
MRRSIRWFAVVARSTYQASSSRPASASASLTFSNVRPSLSTATESALLSFSAITSAGSVPGRTVSVSSCSTSGRPSTAAAPATDVTPGTTSVS